MDVSQRAYEAIASRGLAGPDSPVVLMVSGGSDSTALAYAVAQLRDQGRLGPALMLHVNHRLRGEDSEGDALFVSRLATVLDMQLVSVCADVAGICERESGNLEAVARRVRYEAAHDAQAMLCQEQGCPVADGRIFVAHTADDRVENFYMRSIVGTGPGGFRSMRYRNGQVVRPLMDLSRQDLRDFIAQRQAQGLPVAQGDRGELWREDATNSHTDRFRAYVRHEIVPLAKDRNPRLLETLTRAMNVIADEDDMIADMASTLFDRHVHWLAPREEGCLISPVIALQPRPLQRRVVVRVLERMLDADARLETASVDAVLGGFDGDGMNSGYVANIQGNLAVSANKNGVRVEPMAAFRTRRNRL